MGIAQLAIQLFKSTSLQVRQRSIQLLSQMQMVESIAREVLENKESGLLASLLNLMLDKEYSLARYAAEMLKNISKFFNVIVISEDSAAADYGLMYRSLVRIDQSEDIFLCNLETIYNLLQQHQNGAVSASVDV